MPEQAPPQWMTGGLAELHVHLRGAMPQSLLARKLQTLSPRDAIATSPEHFQRTFSAAPNVRQLLDAKQPELQLENFYTYRHLTDFLAAYLFTGCFINTAEDFEELVTEVLDTLHTQGVIYAEITVSLVEYLLRGIPAREIFSILKNTSPPSGLRVNWIVDLVRNMGVRRCEELLETVRAHRFDTLVGITLGGSEKEFPPELFEDLYAQAKKAGLHCTVHAGEALGPQSVSDALDILKVDRIGHGVRAIEDSDLVKRLAAEAIPLEVCPWGNVVTGIYPSLEEHPIRELYEAGVPLSVNTDDPAFFSITLRQQFEQLENLGFSAKELQDIALNGIHHAFLDKSEKDELLKVMNQ